VWENCKNFVGDTFSGLSELVKVPINAVISIVNGAIDAINNIKFTVPEWVPGIGGKGWQGLDIPHIPTLASGTDNWKGGIAQISERGGEIVDLPSGSRVYPHDESVQKAREEGKKTINITLAKLADQIVVREDADIDRIAEAFAKKLGQTMVNMA
ncbi:MAG: phage tail tape measure protein, partial [Blautia sp.]|nr:phage tail tape measure protein [Blautia sp.]